MTKEQLYQLTRISSKLSDLYYLALSFNDHFHRICTYCINTRHHINYKIKND